jgi:hypothetical protein
MRFGRFRIITRASLKRLAALALLLVAGGVWVYVAMIRMPGKSFEGALPALTAEQTALRDQLRSDVEMIGGTIGPRNIHFFPRQLERAAEFITSSAEAAGLTIDRQPYSVAGMPCANLIAEIPGTSRPGEIVVVGAHYDGVETCPAANDNGSGVAGTLALMRHFASAAPPQRTLRFLYFVNEEPPYFQTDNMGSRVYARACRARGENIVAMISLETIGYYSDEPGSQRYPVSVLQWMYPTTGNFISFVGDYRSRKLVRRAIASFRNSAQFPSEGAAMPGFIAGVAWSDQWAFWQEGYPGIMVTDTAPYRYPHYHHDTDTPDKLDYDRFARVVDGMKRVIEDLARGD